MSSNRLVARGRAALAAALLLATPGPGRAAELEGVRLPDSMEVGGTRLQLNGIGLRTVTIFQVGVYVAGFYLEQPSQDENLILDSPQTKVLDLHFIHDAPADKIRQAWQEGFDSDCTAPCRLPAAAVAEFMSRVVDMRAGDTCTLVYTKDYVSIAINGREMGRVTDKAFMRAMLTTFIGPHPPTQRLKRELLGRRN